MAASDLRWGLVGSERRFRIIRRDFRKLGSGEVRPFLLMSGYIDLDSPTLQITKTLLYMLLTGRRDIPHLAAPYAFSVPPGDPMTQSNRSPTQSSSLGHQNKDTPMAAESSSHGAVCIL